MSSLVAWLVALQIRRPVVPLAIVALATLFFGVHASRLALRTQYDALLPENAPSVIELRRLERRTSVSQTVLVLLEGSDRTTLRRMGDAVTTDLGALGPTVVSRAEDGTQQARAFIVPRSALFLDKPQLERVKEQVDARWDYEVSKADGFALDDDAPPPPLPTEETLGHDRRVDRFPTGYFENADGTALVVAAHSPIAGGDLPRVQDALDRIRAAVERVHAAPGFEAIRVSYAGDMPTGFAEYHLVLADLLGVGALGLALVLAVVVFYFLRVRAVVVMGVTILVGLVWTFGLTEIVIGHLNIATAFLVSIVAGNGINVGILYQSRYFEERGRGVGAEEAIRRSVSATWLPTVIAAVAAAASYGSLLATDFRAFRDFGLIAAGGMVICWLVKTLRVPPLLVLLERALPERGPRRLQRFEMAYGRPFAWLAPRSPRAVLAVSVVLVLAGVVAGVRYASSDPLDYDTRTLENDSANSSLQHAWKVCNGILGASQGAMIVATDSAEDARALVSVLRERWEAAPAGHKPFAAVHSLWDFVPREQQGKIPIARELGDRLERAHTRGFVNAADWEKLRGLVPPADLAPFGIEDLPDAVAAPFTESSGARGTLLLVEPEPDTSNDLRSLVRFAEAYRTTRLPSGKVVQGSGSAVIFADMLAAVARDVPRAVLLSLMLTLAVVLVTFRRQTGDLLTVLFALSAGIGGVALYLYSSGVKINFLNFAALPVTFGIGVDYSINVAQRYIAGGKTDMAGTLRSSGGAVVLCSLTTLLGYLALLGSHNRAIRSLGAIAAVGEVCCLVGAVVVLPALCITLQQRAAFAKKEVRT